MSATSNALPPGLFDLEAFCRQLDAEDAIACCKSSIGAATAYLHEQFRTGTEVQTLLALRSDFMDAMLGALWDQRDWRGAKLALVAVGGYGRRELHPHSDIDLLILLGEGADKCSAEQEQFLTLLWDIGLDIGHSVRTVEQCRDSAREEITVLTNLLEARVIRGSAELMAAVREKTGVDKMWPSAEFFRAKLEEQQSRHAKFLLAKSQPATNSSIR